MTTLQLRKSIGRLPLRPGFLLIPLVLACFGLSPAAHAVSPAPDGGYPGQNTAEGDSALLNLTTGVQNTAVGYNSLKSDIAGQLNTAVGSSALATNTASLNTAVGGAALFRNTTGSFNTANGTVRSTQQHYRHQQHGCR